MKKFACDLRQRLTEKLGPNPVASRTLLNEIAARRACSEAWRQGALILPGSRPDLSLDLTTLSDFRLHMDNVVRSKSFPMMGGLPRGGAFPKILTDASAKLEGRDGIEHRKKMLNATLRLCFGPANSTERLEEFNSNEAVIWAYEHGHNYDMSRARAASCVIPTALLSMTDPQREFIVRVEDSLTAYENCGGAIPDANEYLDGRYYNDIRCWAEELLPYLGFPDEIGLLGVYCALMMDASASK